MWFILIMLQNNNAGGGYTGPVVRRGRHTAVAVVAEGRAMFRGDCAGKGVRA